jgi:two-component system cell cycle sensor histidine kinase/response regulator CckA
MLSDTDGEEKILIMVVDDEEVIRNMVKDFLSDKGYEIIIASNGPEALEKFRQNEGKVDLVLLDMVLPGKSGMEILEDLRQINPRVKAIMTSGYSRDITENNLDKDITSFMQKPFRIATLIQKIKELMSISQP